MNLERKPITLMAIGGHIGDMELTAGGVLAKHSLLGDKIVTVALTAGEKGKPAGVNVKDYRKQKVDEAQGFARMLHGEAVVLDYEDGDLPNDQTVRYQVAQLIRQYKPNLLITHWTTSMHKDHMATSTIVKDAQFYAGVDGFSIDGSPHFSKGPYYAENWEDPTGFKPYIFIDITDGYQLWKEAAALHQFVTQSKSFKYLEYYDHLSFIRGAECRRPRAQAFAVDPIQMKVVKDSF